MITMNNDLISRQAAITNYQRVCREIACNDCPFLIHVTDTLTDCRLERFLHDLPSAQPKPQWIPCSERLPERIIDDDVETVQEFFVTVKERWPGEEWKYHTDIAEYPGDYIDDVWQTFNDWREGQEVHVIAWMPLPPSYKGDEDERN